jgi:hypothetical protein
MPVAAVIAVANDILIMVASCLAAERGRTCEMLASGTAKETRWIENLTPSGDFDTSPFFGQNVRNAADSHRLNERVSKLMVIGRGCARGEFHHVDLRLLPRHSGQIGPDQTGYLHRIHGLSGRRFSGDAYDHGQGERGDYS